MINNCFTLGYNLPEEIRKNTALLYELNCRKDFRHLIVDLGFPLEDPEVIPDDLEVAKNNNSEKLRAIAADYGSDYIKMENVGVSQNWTAVCRHLNLKDDDIAIGTDPDEYPIHEGWVKAMGDVLRSGYNMGVVCLFNDSEVPLIPKIGGERLLINGHKVITSPKQLYSVALMGISGRFLKAIGYTIPAPRGAQIYGWIEGVLFFLLQRTGFSLGLLEEYHETHTVWKGKSIFQDWKYHIVNHVLEGQFSFDKYLELRREGKL